MMSTFDTVLPNGSLNTRIRYTTRDCNNRIRIEDSLGSALGNESEGLVMIDFQGHPIRYDQLTVLDQVVAMDRCRLQLEVQTKTDQSQGRWRNVGSAIELNQDTSWAGALRRGAEELIDLHVKAGDPHYEAKLFPHLHPYGSGTLGSPNVDAFEL